MGSSVCLMRTRETVQAFVVVLAMKILSKLPSSQPVPLNLLLGDGGSCVLKEAPGLRLVARLHPIRRYLGQEAMSQSPISRAARSIEGFNVTAFTLNKNVLPTSIGCHCFGGYWSQSWLPSLYGPELW